MSYGIYLGIRSLVYDSFLGFVDLAEDLHDFEEKLETAFLVLNKSGCACGNFYIDNFPVTDTGAPVVTPTIQTMKAITGASD